MLFGPCIPEFPQSYDVPTNIDWEDLTYPEDQDLIMDPEDDGSEYKD